LKALGHQYLIELYECEAAAIEDLENVSGTLLEAARLAGATIVGSDFHHFDPQGVSGVVIISESHFSVHTWPEHRYAAVDLFTCDEGLRIDDAYHHLISSFGSRRYSMLEILRGKEADLNTPAR
jgi:S-adenosylmethionine decarboxylase proenzyme